MNKGIRIFKIFGITVRIDWSWLLILLLTIWNLSSLFSSIHPDWALWKTIVVATAAAMLFFLSVLAHELAHSLIARGQGIPVKSITLFLFGGVSNIREEPKSPWSEFFMAVMGPVTSLVLGFVLILAAGVGSPFANVNLQRPGDIFQNLGVFRTLAVWLGSINMTLGIFNLIPGFPLDGGRILRSIFWAVIKDLRKATRWASAVGQVIAWGLIVSGIAMVFGLRVPFFGQGVSSGLWLVLIGWFLNNAARRGYQQLVLRDALEDVPTAKLMRADPPTVSPDITVEALIENHIMKSDDHAFPVIQEGSLVGVVCLDDVRQTPRSERKSTPIREIMTGKADLVTLNADSNAYQGLKALAENDIRQIIVLEGDQMVGLLRRRDVVRYLQIEIDAI